MDNITNDTRTFVARSAQQGLIAPAVWLFKDPNSPKGDDTLTAMVKYATGASQVDRTTITLKEQETVLSDEVYVQPYGGATLRVEAIFDRNTPYSQRLVYLNELKAILDNAQIIAALTAAQPAL